MMNELKAIRNVLNARAEGNSQKLGAIERVAAITISQLGATSPSLTPVTTKT